MKGTTGVVVTVLSPCCLESPAVKPSKQSTTRRLWPGPGNFYTKMVWMVIPELVSVQGWCCSPHRCLSPGLQKMAKKLRWSTNHSICQILPQLTCFCIGERSQSWQASRCPRKASRADGMGLSKKMLPKASPLLLFSARWTAAKNPFESAGTMGLGLKSPKIMKFLKWFVWKLFRPVHLFLITPCTWIFLNNTTLGYFKLLYILSKYWKPYTRRYPAIWIRNTVI